MGDIDTLFTLLAVALGVAHAIYLYRQEVRLFRAALPDHAVKIRIRASYYAVWAFALWWVLGPYIVGYWLLAIVPYLIARAMGKTLGTPKVQTAR